MIFPNRRMDSCLENAFSSNYLQPIIVTTKSQSNGSNKTVCRFGQIDYITRGAIILSGDDDEAQFYVGDNDCYTNQILGDSSTISMNISGAKSHNENFNRLPDKGTENQSTGGLTFSAVIGGGAGAVVLLVITASYEHDFFLGVEFFLNYTPERTISP